MVEATIRIWSLLRSGDVTGTTGSACHRIAGCSNMISIQECRKHVGEQLTDEQVVAVRDALYPLVEGVLDRFLGGHQESAAHTGDLNNVVSRGMNAVCNKR